MIIITKFMVTLLIRAFNEMKLILAAMMEGQSAPNGTFRPAVSHSSVVAALTGTTAHSHMWLTMKWK